MVGIRKRFVDIKLILNDDIKGIEVDFDEDLYYYTVTAKASKFKRHPQVSPELSFGSYIMRRLIDACNMIYAGANEPVIDNGTISIMFQLVG